MDIALQGNLHIRMPHDFAEGFDVHTVFHAREINTPKLNGVCVVIAMTMILTIDGSFSIFWFPMLEDFVWHFPGFFSQIVKMLIDIINRME